MPQYPIRIDLEAARRATAARDAAKAQQKAKQKAKSDAIANTVLNPAQAVARGNRMQRMEVGESKVINSSGTGYGSFRNR